MVIECPECTTKFRVAAEKIPAKGAKLRCARCSHIFFVKPEVETPAEAAPMTTEETASAVEEALSKVEPSATGGAFDFDQPTTEDDFRTEDKEVEEDDPFADDGEFSFSGETSTTEDEPDDAFDFGDPFADKGDEESDLGFDFEDRPSGEIEEPETGLTEDDFGFDSTSEDGATDEIGTGVNDEFDGSAFADATSDEDDAFDFGEDYGNVDLGGGDDGSQSFSFEEDEDAGEELTMSSAADESDIPAEDEATPLPASAPQDEPLDASMDAPVEPYPELDEDDIPEPLPDSLPVVKKKRSPFGTLILFILVLIVGLVIAGGVLYWQSGPQALLDLYQQVTGQPASPQSEGEILVKNLQGRFVINESAGELLVIEGDAVNNFKEARAAIQVKGILYDEQGKQLRQKTIFCGNPISPEDLRALPYDKLEETMGNQFGESLVNLNVTPGQVIPFTIVFRDIPASLSEFVVEVADSNPAAQ